MSRFACVCVSLFVLGLSACAVTPPKVTAKKARLTNISLSSMRVLVDLDVNNPNEFSLPVEQFIWGLKISNKQLANGTVGLDKALAANSTTALDVPLRIGLQSAISTISTVLRKKQIPYNVAGNVKVKSPLGVLSVPYNVGGKWANPLLSDAGDSVPLHIAVAMPELPVLVPNVPMAYDEVPLEGGR